jgi:hypothetical protein
MIGYTTRIISGLFFILLSSCQGQSLNQNNCISELKNARKAFNYYLINGDTSQSVLITILREIDSSMQCSNTRMASIELKNSILLKLQKYQEGYTFIDSLNENDFKLKYKKQMWSDNFHALYFEEKGDTISRNNYYEKIIAEIQNYIQQEKSSDMIDKEAYYDLFTIKAKVLNEQELDKEFEDLIKQYPNDKDFIDALKSSIEENGSKSEEIQGEPVQKT